MRGNYPTYIVSLRGLPQILIPGRAAPAPFFTLKFSGNDDFHSFLL